MLCVVRPGAAPGCLLRGGKMSRRPKNVRRGGGGGGGGGGGTLTHFFFDFKNFSTNIFIMG